MGCGGPPLRRRPGAAHGGPGALDGRAALLGAIEAYRPDGVLDLSDEPVLDYRRRLEDGWEVPLGNPATTMYLVRVTR